MDIVTIKRGDTRTAPDIDLITPAGNPVDLTGATVRFLMMKGSTVLIDKEATIIDAEGGRVAYFFESGETNLSGSMKAWFKVTYPDYRTETFPNEDYIIIKFE